MCAFLYVERAKYSILMITYILFDSLASKYHLYIATLTCSKSLSEIITLKKDVLGIQQDTYSIIYVFYGLVLYK
jgi:hypothetical protein